MSEHTTEETLMYLRQCLLPGNVQDGIDLEVPSWLVREAVAKLSKMEETLADCLGEYERLTVIEAQAKTYMAHLGTSRAHVERAALAEALAGGEEA